MKYMIRCDIEGVTGVVSYQQAEPGTPEFAYARQMLMADLMAAIEGLRDGGADRIIVYDEHYVGRNVDLSVLPSIVSVICGKPPYREDWPGGLDASFAGVILLGLHSKWGTPGGVLAHTYEPDIRNIELNGVSVGEIGIEAAVAGDCGVPVVMVTADSAGVAEAEALLPGVRGVVVKEALGGASALCYPVQATRKLIHDTAAELVTTPPDVKPYWVENNATLQITFNNGPYLKAVRQELSDQMQGEDVLLIRAPTATAAYADYWKKKLHCQAIVASWEI